MGLFRFGRLCLCGHFFARLRKEWFLWRLVCEDLGIFMCEVVEWKVGAEICFVWVRRFVLCVCGVVCLCSVVKNVEVGEIDLGVNGRKKFDRM